MFFLKPNQSREGNQSMDLALGAMGSLLPKLGELLKEEYKMQSSVKRDVGAFSRELESMSAALRRVAEVPRDQLDEEVKLWAGDVRELSYDTEDIVDSLLVRVKGLKPDSDMNGFRELMGKMKSLFKKGKACREIATAIKDIRKQVQDVAARHERYKADGIFANAAVATRITVDPLLVALYKEQQRLVGINSTRDELIENLRLDDDLSNQPKVLSIVGFGGLGKTTLAKAIYDKVRSDFDCTAFVSVSRSPDLKKVFKDILFDVDKEKYLNLKGAALDEKQLIDQLQESLGAKRYFIVVDDIWDVSAWQTIRYALMGNTHGSKIITTTRNVSVSTECCSCNDDMVYNMKPLSDGDSQRLFYNIIFPGDNMCPPELHEVSMNILKKCSGVPLAIITLASQLSSNQQIKPSSEWYFLLNSIGSGLTKGDANLDEMRRILSFSYYDLPSHLKTCLIYLSIFPEDYIIDRYRLIRRWIAEGFIQGDNLFELGESYFNELVNRSLIQPLDIDIEGMQIGCRVHDIMLDLICDLASEENFVTVLDDIKGNTPLERKVRRLSLQKIELMDTQLATRSISQLRSFTIFGPAINQKLPLSRFEVLRVLDLEDCIVEKSDHLNLSCVGDLLHLRYLGLRNTKLLKIPAEIGKLLFLQTLDLRGVHVNAEELPASFVRLRNLMFLYVSGVTYLPVGYRNLTSLRELTKVHFTQDGDPEELPYLTELRVLVFHLPSRYHPEKLLILFESLGKLQKLQSLYLFSDDESIDIMGDWVPSSLPLRNIRLGGWYERMPTRISSSLLPLVFYLDINVHQVRLEDIQVLGTLPALRVLHLLSDVDTATKEERATQRSFMLRADSFPCAIEFSVPHVLLPPYMLTRGAMPLVRVLRFGLLVSDILRGGQWDWDLGIGKLPALKTVWIKLYGEEKTSSRYSEAEAALVRAVPNHPNHPRIMAF
uniref:Uncharacterized protein n=1 Tax=Avena sativa TaxID=4498 RepID=A0ACD5TCJ5_AVESA